MPIDAYFRYLLPPPPLCRLISDDAMIDAAVRRRFFAALMPLPCHATPFSH